MTKKKHPRDRGERLRLREKDKEKTAGGGLKRRKKEEAYEVPFEINDKQINYSGPSLSILDSNQTSTI